MRPRRRIIRWRALLVALLTTAAASVTAHEVRPAYLEITETAPEVFSVVWKQPVLADRRLAIEVALPRDCERGREELPEHTGAALIERWQTECNLRSGILRIDGLAATLTDALVRISYLDGDVRSQILRPATPGLDLGAANPAIGGYFVLGVEHLVFGIDHILFVIGLVLFIRTPLTLLKTVTAFTVAHSITLALSVLDLVRVPQGPVEAVIALSILFLARELTVSPERRSRLTQAAPWIMAFAFGLLHGFGFAGALADIGLPREQLALSLLLFNLGIEAGQLAVIAVLLAGEWAARRAAAGFVPLAERGFTVAMGCVAGFWTIDRVLLLL
ncbi:MAG: HupE/UreJ family protein [Pseudomonadales bacterium]